MAFSDYLELLEHLPKVGSLLTRVLPLLEGYFGTPKPAPDPAVRASLDALAVEAAKTNAAHAALARKIDLATEGTNALAGETRELRYAVQALESRLAAIEQRQRKQLLLMLCYGFVSACALLLIAILLLTKRH